MREPPFNRQELLLFSCTSSVARPTTESLYRNFYIPKDKAEFGYMGNVTALITHVPLEMQKSTIWKLSHPPMKPVWVLQDSLALWCLCTMIPPELQIREVFLTIDINYSAQSKLRSRFPAKLIKSPGTWSTAQKHPSGSMQSQLGPSGLISSDTAWKQLQGKAGSGNSRDVLTWHSTWTNKLQFWAEPAPG